MTIETAVYAVQRGGSLFQCKGRDFCDKLQSGDMFAVTRSNGTTYQYGWRDDHDSKIQDTDAVGCTDTDGVTKKITGAQFKSLLQCAPPRFTINVEKCHHKCTTSSKKAGDFYIKPTVTWIDPPSGDYSIIFNAVLLKDKTGNWIYMNTSTLCGGNAYTGNLVQCDPQDNPDPYFTPKVETKVEWTFEKGSTTIDSGVEYLDFDAEPTWTDSGNDWGIDESAILRSVYADVSCKFKMTFTESEILTPYKQCMRPVLKYRRFWYKGRWSTWFRSGNGEFGRPVIGSNAIFQAFTMVRYAYDPSTSFHTMIPLEDKVMEYAVTVQADGCSASDWNSRIELGGYYSWADVEEPPKFFTPVGFDG